MPEILQLEFVQQFPTFIVLCLYFVFWGSVVTLVVLLCAAIYDKFWGPINGDFLQSFERKLKAIKFWIETKVFNRDPFSLLVERKYGKLNLTEEQGQNLVRTFAPQRSSKTAFNFPTFQVRRRPFDHEWDK